MSLSCSINPREGRYFEFLIRVDVTLSWLPWLGPFRQETEHRMLLSVCSRPQMATRCWNLLQNHVAITTTNPGLCTHLDVWACVCMWCYYGHVPWRLKSIWHSLKGSTQLKTNVLANVHLSTHVHISGLGRELLAKNLNTEQPKWDSSFHHHHSKLKLEPHDCV